MSLKVIVGIILLLAGLGSGVVEWIRSGLMTPMPVLGLALSAIGVYLIIDGLRGRRRVRAAAVRVPKEAVTVGGLLAALVAGTIAIQQLEARRQRLTDEEILEMERQLEALRAQGKVSYEKYLEIKSMIEQLKASRGLR